MNDRLRAVEDVLARQQAPQPRQALSPVATFNAPGLDRVDLRPSSPANLYSTDRANGRSPRPERVVELGPGAANNATHEAPVYDNEQPASHQASYTSQLHLPYTAAHHHLPNAASDSVQPATSRDDQPMTGGVISSNVLPVTPEARQQDLLTGPSQEQSVQVPSQNDFGILDQLGVYLQFQVPNTNAVQEWLERRRKHKAQFTSEEWEQRLEMIAEVCGFNRAGPWYRALRGEPQVQS